MTRGPRQISDRAQSVDVTGYFMPFETPLRPVLVGMPDTDDLFVLVFSSRDLLVASMASLGIEYAGVSIVSDGGELADEMVQLNALAERPYRIRLAVDVHRADNGRLHFVEVPLPQGS